MVSRRGHRDIFPLKPSHRLIELPTHTDPRGALVFAQDGDHLPFPVRRFFALYEVAPGATRGGHAHRLQHQLLVVFGGAVNITVDDGKSRNAIMLDRPTRALHIPPMLWLELTDFTPGAVCLVLASDLYAEADYIRSRDEFIRLTAN